MRAGRERVATVARAVCWMCARMTLHKPALLRVVSRSNRNRRGTFTSIHRYALSACRRRLEGGSVKNQDSENVIMCVGFVDTHGPLNPMATANDWISRGFT